MTVAYDLLGNAAPLMKRRYDDRSVYKTAFTDRPLFAWIPKKTGITGGSPLGDGYGGYQVPISIDDIAGESANFAAAVAARDGDTAKVWQLNRIKRYGTATIDWETVRAMKDDVGAFMRAITPRIDSAINQMSNSIALQLYGDSSGARGIIDTGGVTGEVVTLTAASSYLARGWGLKRSVQASTAAFGGTARGTTAKIEGVYLNPGGKAEITFETGGVAALTGLTDGDYLFPSGDHGATAATAVCLDGMLSWGPDPTTITGGDDWKGVDRSVYKERLLMLHYDASSGDIDANVRLAAATLQANGGQPDVLFLHPNRWAALETALVGGARYEMMLGTDASTGFDTIVINAGGKKCNVVSDPWCPPDQGFMLKKSTWEMFSIDRVPDFVSDDGNRLHRMEGADQVEFRMGGYFNVVCRAPGHNMVINFV